MLYKDVRLFSLSNDEQFYFHLLDYSCSKKENAMNHNISLMNSYKKAPLA